MSEHAAGTPGSFDPTDHTQGGFFDDVDCTIVAAEIVAFDYQGTREPVCALGVTYRKDGNDDPEDDRIEYYNIGPMDKFVPSQDKKFYLPVGAVMAMNKSCKASLYLQALREKGFPMASVAKGIDGLGGLHVHVNIVPMPKFKDEKGQEKEAKILLVTKLLDGAAPAAAKGGKKAAGSGAAGGTKPAAGASKPATTAGASVDGAEDRATAVILGKLAENGGSMNKAQVPSALFAEIPSSEGALRNACIALSANPAWMGGEDRPWTVDGGEVKLRS